MLKNSFWEEINKIINDKVLLIVLFGLPIFITLLIGRVLSQEVLLNVPIAVIDLDNSELSRQIINYFNQNQTFSVDYFPENEKEMEKLIRNSKARAGLIIPQDFYKDVMLAKSPEILMVYDGSHMSMTSATKSSATEILLTLRSGAAIKQMMARLNLSYQEAYQIAQAISLSNRMLYNPQKSFEDFLAPVLFAGGVQSALVLTASASVEQDIYFEDKKKRKGYAGGKTLAYTLAGTFSMMACILTQIIAFNTSFRGNIFLAGLLSVGLSFGVSAFCVFISSLLDNKSITMVIAALVFIPNSIMVGTTWPFYAMPKAYQMLCKLLPLEKFAVNLRDIYLKNIGIEQVIKDIAYMIIFGIIAVLLAEYTISITEQRILTKEEDDVSANSEAGASIY